MKRLILSPPKIALLLIWSYPFLSCLPKTSSGAERAFSSCCVSHLPYIGPNDIIQAGGLIVNAAFPRLSVICRDSCGYSLADRPQRAPSVNKGRASLVACSALESQITISKERSVLTNRVPLSLAHTPAILLRWLLIVRRALHITDQSLFFAQLLEPPYHLLNRLTCSRLHS